MFWEEVYESIEALNALNEDVAVYKEAVAASKALNLVAALPVNVNTLALNEFSDAVWASIEEVNAVNEAVCAANDDVKVNTVESNPSNKSALAA